MSLLTVARRGVRLELPRAPTEIQDEVELYAREHGRTGSISFVPTLMVNTRPVMGTWRVTLSLRVNDPRWQLYQAGEIPEPPVEEVWLHEPNPQAGQPFRGLPGQRHPDYLGLDIHQLGAAGVRAFLERGNTWSGRGQYDSVADELRVTREANETQRTKVRQDAKDANRQAVKERRRWWLKIPLVNVALDLKQRITSKEKAS